MRQPHLGTLSVNTLLIAALITIVAWASLIPSATANTPDNSSAPDNTNTLSNALLVQQRANYVEAKRLLKSRQITRFKKLLPSLEDYPLYPYLEYAQIRRTLSRQKPETIRDFLDTYEGSYLADKLRRAWLENRAKKKHWQTFLDFYAPGQKTTLQCYHLRALYNTGKKQQAFEQAPNLWLKGKSQPKACDPIFKAWMDAGELTEDLLWQRIDLAMNAHQTQLARYLIKLLPNNKRTLGHLYLDVRNRPHLLKKSVYQLIHDKLPIGVACLLQPTRV